MQFWASLKDSLRVCSSFLRFSGRNADYATFYHLPVIFNRNFSILSDTVGANWLKILRGHGQWFLGPNRKMHLRKKSYFIQKNNWEKDTSPCFFLFWKRNPHENSRVKKKKKTRREKGKIWISFFCTIQQNGPKTGPPSPRLRLLTARKALRDTPRFFFFFF